MGIRDALRWEELDGMQKLEAKLSSEELGMLTCRMNPIQADPHLRLYLEHMVRDFEGRLNQAGFMIKPITLAAIEL
jgi:hypothetical protein